MSLDEILLYTISNARQVYKPAFNSFIILYELGIRHVELNPNRISILPDNSILVISAKKSEQRIIQSNTVSIPTYELIKRLSISDIIESRTTLSNYFNALSFPYRITSDNHELVLHSFRHRFIKKQMAIFNNANVVQSMIGHKSITNTLVYINSVIKINTL